MGRLPTPQAAVSSYGPRMQKYPNALLQPMIPAVSGQTNGRTGKRAINAYNYAEDLNGDDEDDDYDGPKRFASSRKARDDANGQREALIERMGQIITGPVDVQPVERLWIVPGAVTRYELFVHSFTSPLTNILVEPSNFMPRQSFPMS